MSTKIKYEKDVENAPAIEADVDHGVVNSEKEDNINLGVVQQSSEPAEEMKLDDARRVKAVSPGLLVAKRFFRNKLALVGLGTLIVLFLFCFLGAAIYPYSQSQTFNTYKLIRVDYAFVRENSNTFKTFAASDKKVSSLFDLKINSFIIDMETQGLTEKEVTDAGDNNHKYILIKNSKDLYTLVNNDPVVMTRLQETAKVGTYSANKVKLTVKLDQKDDALEEALQTAWSVTKKDSDVSVNYNGNVYTLAKNEIKCAYPSLYENTDLRNESITDQHIDQAKANLGGSFVIDGITYNVTAYGSDEVSDKGYAITVLSEYVALYASTLSFDRYDLESVISNEFTLATFAALSSFDENDPATSEYVFDGKTYAIKAQDEGVVVERKEGENKVGFVYLSNVSIRRYTGEDTISLTTKGEFRKVIKQIKEQSLKNLTTTIRMEALDEEGNYVYDDNGDIIFADEEFYIETEEKGNAQQFVFRNKQDKMVADINAKPSKEHILGLDGNAMDVFARIMYGGRISLLIGFIVVFIEIILGSIMGGISGYFGGVVDNVIMRIVDIFYCIPTMPILIILGATFNTLQLDNTLRVVYMMMVLGFLGWPGIARLVRGQILSLREQDFMTAAEASGLTAKRKIAKHLIPNVIPQLIVQATMGLGGVILTESTLSFLGLGVKFPISTWGQIINSVSSIAAMQTYTYIWIPVGVLICLAVIAFNFVGDGLRDAFDPRSGK